jgi:ribosomal protein S18 acetylase RimI-like enzyme
MNAPAVRLAEPSDLDWLAALFDDYRQFYGQPPDRPRALQFLAERLARADSVLFVAPHASGLGGFCQLYPGWCSVEAAPIMVLYDLFVAPAARQLGLAGALMAAAEAHARTAGCVRLDLSTAHDNLAAQALYESRGWERDTRFRVYSFTL